jgi:hypothetical protein
MRSTRWAGLGEERYKRCNEIIRKRYDKLRETESTTKFGAGVSAGAGPTIGGTGLFEKRTSWEPPGE